MRKDSSPRVEEVRVGAVDFILNVMAVSGWGVEPGSEVSLSIFQQSLWLLFADQE